LFVGKIFATDRPAVPKGMIEVYLLTLQSQRELKNTRAKLRLLEERYEASKREGASNERVQELSRRSLRRLINQLKEELARFESRSSK
jgi:hypothetical protein